VGAFARSSVLKAVNGEDFAAVPRRLGQWVKAGGRTLPGLVKRRAAEAALFLSRAETTGAEEAPAGPVAPQVTKPMLRSRTLWSAAVVAAATLLKTLQPPAALAWGLTICVIGAAAVIFVERLRKMKWEGL
jgi:lysozyme